MSEVMEQPLIKGLEMGKTVAGGGRTLHLSLSIQGELAKAAGLHKGERAELWVEDMETAMLKVTDALEGYTLGGGSRSHTSGRLRVTINPKSISGIDLPVWKITKASRHAEPVEVKRISSGEIRFTPPAWLLKEMELLNPPVEEQVEHRDEAAPSTSHEPAHEPPPMADRATEPGVAVYLNAAGTKPSLHVTIPLAMAQKAHLKQRQPVVVDITRDYVEIKADPGGRTSLGFQSIHGVAYGLKAAKSAHEELPFWVPRKKMRRTAVKLLEIEPGRVRLSLPDWAKPGRQPEPLPVTTPEAPEAPTNGHVWEEEEVEARGIVPAEMPAIVVDLRAREKARQSMGIQELRDLKAWYEQEFNRLVAEFQSLSGESVIHLENTPQGVKLRVCL